MHLTIVGRNHVFTYSPRANAPPDLIIIYSLAKKPSFCCPKMRELWEDDEHPIHYSNHDGVSRYQYEGSDLPPEESGSVNAVTFSYRWGYEEYSEEPIYYCPFCGEKIIISMQTQPPYPAALNLMRK